MAVIALVLTALGLGIFSLLLLGLTAQNSEEFGRFYTVILIVDVIGAAVLLGLIIGNLVRLLRDYRRRVPGARLKARMVFAFVGLAIAPVALVYLFAVQFLNAGIDTWFDVRVEKGLTDALQLSRSALELGMREKLERTLLIADELGDVADTNVYQVLGELRRESGANEVTIFADSYRIIATSSDSPADQMPVFLSEEALLQLRQKNTFVALEPAGDGSFKIRTAVVLPRQRAGIKPPVLQAIFSLGERLGPLADSVQQTYTRYGELSFLRGPLKDTFTLTLSVVVLLSLLTAVYGAFFFAKRIVAPIQHLVAGTRAVAEGNFDTRLPMAGKDEIGFLVDSFNDMIERLGEARAEARRSEQQVESERANLEVILARLSTGVIALEQDLTISIANEAAGTILGIDFSDSAGHSLETYAAENPILEQFVVACRERLESGGADWRDQLVLKSDQGKRTLMCASTALPATFFQRAGLVVVFDDITELLRAQKDAAWREVARRLAHEIKNPLTPIQLAAERLRRKYLGSMPDPQAEQLLDRATHTIVQQVEAMRDMVNAFSEYARAPEMNISRVNLNRLITQVADLYRATDSQSKLELKLDTELPEIDADAVRIRQVLHNLIRNAMEAMEGQDSAGVEISTAVVDEGKVEFAEISVRDNGPGFPTDGLEKIFEPYMTSKAKGTGLGLAIVKKLIEEHGGVITVENHPGQGACIKIRLPVAEAGGDSGDSGRRAQGGQRERA